MSDSPEKIPVAENGTERCIICQKELHIPVSTPITEREWYIQGCGQLCDECYRLVTRSSQTDDFTTVELKYIANLSKATDY